ncbi:MAG: QueT transporter family protein [bacterium]|nr:QueT transporter family protein [bacterium]
MKKSYARKIVSVAIIAALYSTATYLSASLNLAYGPLQFRFSEAFNVFAIFTPAAVPGLTIGCMVANIASPYGIVDMLLGSLATFLTTSCSYLFAKKCRKFSPIAVSIFAAFWNSLLVGISIGLLLPEGSTFLQYIIPALNVGLSELIVCCVLGIPLYYWLDKNEHKIFR